MHPQKGLISKNSREWWGLSQTIQIKPWHRVSTRYTLAVVSITGMNVTSCGHTHQGRGKVIGLLFGIVCDSKVCSPTSKMSITAVGTASVFSTEAFLFLTCLLHSLWSYFSPKQGLIVGSRMSTTQGGEVWKGSIWYLFKLRCERKNQKSQIQGSWQTSFTSQNPEKWCMLYQLTA